VYLHNGQRPVWPKETIWQPCMYLWFEVFKVILNRLSSIANKMCIRCLDNVHWTKLIAESLRYSREGFQKGTQSRRHDYLYCIIAYNSSYLQSIRDLLRAYAVELLSLPSHRPSSPRCPAARSGRRSVAPSGGRGGCLVRPPGPAADWWRRLAGKAAGWPSRVPPARRALSRADAGRKDGDPADRQPYSIKTCSSGHNIHVVIPPFVLWRDGGGAF